MSEEAWVTLCTNDTYGLGALVLGTSLRRVATSRDLVVLVTPGVSQSMREELSLVFTHVLEVDVMDSGDVANLALLARPELGVTFTKLHAWRLTQYKKCVFLDADTLVVQNCDELFAREELSAAPDPGWPDCFNSGVFVFVPSETTFKALLDFAIAHGSFDGGDQGLLNMFFREWATTDIRKHLSFVYNLISTATYSYLPAFKFFGSQAKIVHFIGSTKPWLREEPTAGSPFLRAWWSIYRRDVAPRLSANMIVTSPLTGCVACAPSPANCAKFSFVDPWELTQTTMTETERTDHEQARSSEISQRDPFSTPRLCICTKNTTNYQQLSFIPFVEKMSDSNLTKVDRGENIFNKIQTLPSQSRQSFESNVKSMIEKITIKQSSNLVNSTASQSREFFFSKPLFSETNTKYQPIQTRANVTNETDNETFNKENLTKKNTVFSRKESSPVNNNHNYDKAVFTIGSLQIGHSQIIDIPTKLNLKSKLSTNDNGLEENSKNIKHVLTTRLGREQNKSSKIKQVTNERTSDIGTDRQTNRALVEVVINTVSQEPHHEKSGLAGALARGEEEEVRRGAWEAGEIDYLGRDSFDNIWRRICECVGIPTEGSAVAKPPEEPVQEKSPEVALLSALADSTLAKTPATAADKPKEVESSVAAVPVEAVTESSKVAEQQTSAAPQLDTGVIPLSSVRPEQCPLAKQVSEKPALPVEVPIQTTVMPVALAKPPSETSGQPPIISETPVQPPVTAETPLQLSVTAETPVQPPVTADAPVKPPLATEVPVSSVTTEALVPSPVRTEVPIQPPVTAETPVQPPVTAETPVQPPVTAETPVQPPVTAKTPVQPPVSAEPPVQPPVAAESPVQALATTEAPVKPPAAGEVPVSPVQPPLEAPVQLPVTAEAPVQPLVTAEVPTSAGVPTQPTASAEKPSAPVEAPVKSAEDPSLSPEIPLPALLPEQPAEIQPALAPKGKRSPPVLPPKPLELSQSAVSADKPSTPIESKELSVKKKAPTEATSKKTPGSPEVSPQTPSTVEGKKKDPEVCAKSSKQGKDQTKQGDKTGEVPEACPKPEEACCVKSPATPTVTCPSTPGSPLPADTPPEACKLEATASQPPTPPASSEAPVPPKRKQGKNGKPGKGGKK